MTLHDLNEELMTAISAGDLNRVVQCLSAGADPNYVLEIDAENGEQPSTPLKLVVFRISDCMLDECDLSVYVEIAQLLLDHGADPVPALQLAEVRYGACPADPHDISPFMRVWRTIAEASRNV